MPAGLSVVAASPPPTASDLDATCTRAAGVGALDNVKSHGLVDLEFDRRDGETYGARTYQAGCLRARQLGSDPSELVAVAIINTAGGLTGGDSLNQKVAWRPGARATITTPSAEKIYRSAKGWSRVAVRLSVGRDCLAEWLPQETIVFDGAKLDRSMEIHLAEGATFVACEAVVFGRLARNERLRSGGYFDQLKVFRNGRLLLFDRTGVEGDLGAWLDRASTARGCRCSAMLLLAGPGVERVVPQIRQCLAEATELGGISLVRGIAHARILASDDLGLRTLVAKVLGIARQGRSLPRSWSC